MKRNVLSLWIVLVLSVACSGPSGMPDPPAQCSPEATSAPAMPGTPPPPATPPPYTAVPLSTPPSVPTASPPMTSTTDLTVTWPAMGAVYSQTKALIDGTIGVIADDLTELVSAITVDGINFLDDAQDTIPKIIGIVQILPLIFNDFGIVAVMIAILILMCVVLVVKGLLKLVAWIIQVFPFKFS